MMKDKVLVFDFDGTLIDSADILFAVVSEYLPTFTKESYLKEIKDYFLHGSFREILRAIYYEFKLKPHSKKIKTQINLKILDAMFVTGIKEVLTELKNRGVKLIILSSNYKENIESVLTKNELNLFEEVYGEGHLLSKFRTLKKIANANKGADIYYIGDELRDIYAARKAGVPEVGVTWGLNKKEDFEDFKTKIILEKPEELLKL